MHPAVLVTLIICATIVLLAMIVCAVNLIAYIRMEKAAKKITKDVTDQFSDF